MAQVFLVTGQLPRARQGRSRSGVAAGHQVVASRRSEQLARSPSPTRSTSPRSVRDERLVFDGGMGRKWGERG